MSKIIFNHQIFKQEEFHISVNNRAFLYGDGLFESIKIINGNAFNLEAHLSRLFAGIEALKLENSSSKDGFRKDIHLLINENKISKGGTIKIIVFREEGGKYLPKNSKASSVLMSEKSEDNLFTLNKKGLELGLYKSQLKPANSISNLKTMSALQSVMCSLDTQQKSLDDCLMFNSENRIIESANSNVFFVKNDVIFTPKLSEGCVDGTMRNLMLKFPEFEIKETRVNLEEILQADEVFLSNAIQGVKWAAQIENRKFNQKKIAEYLTEKLNDLV